MTDQSISCPKCGEKIALTEALRADIEAAVKQQYEARLERARREAATAAERKSTVELLALQQQLTEQSKELDDARTMELAIRKRERELERRHKEMELILARRLDEQRAHLLSEAKKELTDQHRLKDAEKERQLSDMRRHIEDLKRKAEQGSQQRQGEAGEDTLETTLRCTFPGDDIDPVVQGVRGADIHQVVFDLRGARAGAILWECKNAKNWSDSWIDKLKEDQRALRADVAVLVTASLPKNCRRFTSIDGVVVTDFTCAAPIAAILRANLLQLAQTRRSAITKGEKLELLHQYLSGIEFRQRVEAIVESFDRMQEDLDQERRAAERQWARRTKQIESVTFTISGMYGDLQGLLPALPPIRRLELPCEEPELV